MLAPAHLEQEVNRKESCQTGLTVTYSLFRELYETRLKVAKSRNKPVLGGPLQAPRRP
jgi:hypothetical protein